MAKKKSLEYWIAQALTDQDKEVSCSQMSLMHIAVMPSGHAVPREVHTIHAKEGNTWDAGIIANMFTTKAELYSQNLGGSQTFMLVAKYGKNDADAEHPFVLTGVSGEFQGLVTHPPTPAGQVAQGMELTHAIVVRTFQMQGMLFDQATRQIESLTRRCEHLDEENREVFGLLRNEMMRQVQLQHEQKMKQMEYQRSTEERRMIIKFAPAVINGLLGREIFPQNAEDTAIIETLALAIPEEQIKQLQMLLPAPINGILYDRFIRALKEERASRELARRAAQEATAGELPEEGQGIQ